MFQPHRYLLEVFVTDDVLPLVGVLELVGFDILPQCLDDHWTGLSVNPQETGQAGIQFELGRLKQTAQKGEMATDTANSTRPAQFLLTSYLVVQHQKDSTAHIYISWPLHLEAIRLLSCSSPVPLNRRGHSEAPTHLVPFAPAAYHPTSSPVNPTHLEKVHLISTYSLKQVFRPPASQKKS